MWAQESRFEESAHAQSDLAGGDVREERVEEAEDKRHRRPFTADPCVLPISLALESLCHSRETCPSSLAPPSSSEPSLPRAQRQPKRKLLRRRMAYGDKMSGLMTPPDPLDMALRPPENESDEDRTARLSAEEEAKKVSDMIDEELKAQERAEKRGPKPIKILLLGGCAPR